MIYKYKKSKGDALGIAFALFYIYVFLLRVKCFIQM